jgi:hypothetical protein
MERWKPVLGYEDLYQVSDKGQVRRVAGGQGARAGHILRPQNNGRGYLSVRLCQNGRLKQTLVHVVVAEAFLGRRPKEKLTGLSYVVNHKNGNSSDNRLSNLQWCTWSENSAHACNTLKRGVSRGSQRSHLSEDDVRTMRKRAAAGETRVALAHEFRLSPQQVGSIVLRRCWKHVT